MSRLLCLLLLWLCGAIDGRADNTLRVINDVPASVADPTNVFVQLNYHSASLNPALQKFEVVYPFTADTHVWTLNISAIDGGHMLYGIDPTHEMAAYSKVGDPDVRKMFDGLFEFSLKSTDTIGYWDISNVDWIGLLCRVNCTSGGYPESTWQLAYNKSANALIDRVMADYQFTAAQQAQVLVQEASWGPSWRKMIAPNKDNVLGYPYTTSPGGKTHLADYLTLMELNQTPLCLKANLPSTDHAAFPGTNPPDWETRVAALGATPATFTGKLQLPSAVNVTPPIPAPGLTDKIVLVLSNAACHTEIYYATDALNPETTYRCDSDGGTWVWVMTNRHLNCVTPGNAALFEDWIASLANKICFSFNAGLIPTNTSPAHIYTFSGYANLVPTETNSWQNPPYEVNMYNNVIVENSDSYGMGYSDQGVTFGAKQVIKETLKSGAVVELRILNPNDEPPPPPSTLSMPLAGDFDGDGKADPTVCNPDDGHWQIRLSGNGYTVYDLPNFLGK